MSVNFTGTQVTKTAKDLIYSVSNAIRILGRKYHGLTIEVWANVIWVWGKKQVSRFVSKAKFRQMFVDFRRHGAKSLTVTKDLIEPNLYTVRNEAKDSTRRVEIVPGHKSPIQCTCEDYNAQILAMGKGVCKHGYAVLTELGYSSLSDYIQATT